MIDKKRYEHEMFRLKYQAGDSIICHDAINEFYRNLSGIRDEASPVQNYGIEAKDMDLEGHSPRDVKPTKAASRYKAIITSAMGTAKTRSPFPDGTYDDLAVNH